VDIAAESDLIDEAVTGDGPTGNQAITHAGLKSVWML
jgi:hypothetical protein